MALVVDERDAFAKSMLAQRSRELKARMPGPYDQNRSLRHRDSPIANAQD
jgi:hypothetical protein